MKDKTVIKLVNWALLIMLVGVPLFFDKQTMFPFVAAKTLLFQSLAEIVVFLWIGLAFRDSRYRPRRTPLSAALFFLVSALTVSSIFGADWSVSLWSRQERSIGIFALWHFLLLFFALSSLRGEIYWKKLLRASVLTSAVISLGAIFTSNASVQILLAYPAIARPGSFFGNPTLLAGYLLLNVFIAVWVFADSSRPWKFLAGTAVALNTAGILQTQTLGDIFGLLAGIFIAFAVMAISRFHHFNFKKSVFKNIWLAAIVVFAAFVILFSATKDSKLWRALPGFNRLASGGEIQSSLKNRLLVWRGSLASFKERPVLGWGWDNFPVAFEAHYDPRLLGQSFYDTNFDKPHNIFIEYAVSSGIIGLLAYLAFLAAFAYEALKVYDVRLRAAMLGLIVAYVTRNIVFFDTMGIYLALFLSAAFVDWRFMSRDAAGRGENVAIAATRKESPANLRMPYVFLLLPLLPIYFVNARIYGGLRDEYWGVEYYNNNLLKESLNSFNAALADGGPYRDEALIDFAEKVKQADHNNLGYPDVEVLQKKLAGEMESLIKKHPTDYFYYLSLAEFKNQFRRFDQGYLKEAEALSSAAIALSPRRQQIYYSAARTKVLEERLGEAYTIFEKTVALNPDAPDPHFQFGILAYRNGDIKKGDEEIARANALGRFPETFDEAELLGTLVADLKHDYPSAVNYYRQALAMNPPAIVALEIKIRLAISAYLSGDYSGSRAAFQELAGKVNFKNLAAYSDIKPILERLGIVY